MILTTKHPRASNGVPVFVEAGVVVASVWGLRKIRDEFGSEKMAEVMGVSPRTVDNWCEGHRNVQKPSLMLLKDFLEKEKPMINNDQGEQLKVDSKIHLCDTCSLEFPTCTPVDVEYGDGTGNDNVIKCGAYSPPF